jgi:hypothetical protein
VGSYVQVWWLPCFLRDQGLSVQEALGELAKHGKGTHLWSREDMELVVDWNMSQKEREAVRSHAAATSGRSNRNQELRRGQERQAWRALKALAPAIGKLAEPTKKGLRRAIGRKGA